MPFALCCGCEHIFVIDSAAAAHRYCPTCKELLQVLPREQGLARLRGERVTRMAALVADGTGPVPADSHPGGADRRARARWLFDESTNLIVQARTQRREAQALRWEAREARYQLAETRRALEATLRSRAGGKA